MTDSPAPAKCLATGRDVLTCTWPRCGCKPEAPKPTLRITAAVYVGVLGKDD